MPYIEEKDLVALHEQVEREQATNNKLLDQINEKGISYNKCLKMRNLAWGICVFLLIGGAAAFILWDSILKANNNHISSQGGNTVPGIADQTTLLKEIDSLNIVNQTLKEELMPSDVVYSVQIGAFEKKNISLRSDWGNYIYTPTYLQFRTFSVGIFKTPEEAKDLKKILIEMGFSDAFVSSYQNGNRIWTEYEEK